MSCATRANGAVAAGLLAAMSGSASAGGAETAATLEEPVRQTTRQAAGARYEAGRLQRALFGDDYRDLWVLPVPFEILDLRRFAGGLTPIRRVGSGQSSGLALLGAVHGSAELRLSLGRFHLVLPGEYGVFALVDTGRVWLEGEDSDRWHTGLGGGFWFAYFRRGNAVTLAAARSAEGTSFYVGMGFAL